MLIRKLIAALALVLTLSSCRENPVYDDPYPTPGFISGIASDRFGNPVKGVEVFVYYDFQYLSDEPEPPREWIVSDSTAPVTVAVFDGNSVLRRELFRGIRPPGPLFVSWDGTDSSGRRMASGLYHVRYLQGDSARFEYLQVVDGGLVARTDAMGAYAVDISTLSLGFEPLPIFSNSSGHFLGIYQISNRFGLAFETPYTTNIIETTAFPHSGQRIDVTIE